MSLLSLRRRRCHCVDVAYFYYLLYKRRLRSDSSDIYITKKCKIPAY